MIEVNKLKKPLKIGNKYIYPITDASQIIMEDGVTRLPVKIEEIEEEIESVNEKTSIYKIVESYTFTPTSIAANSHVHQVFTLSKTYTFNRCRFLICPVSYANCAYISVNGHWGSDSQSAASLTESNQLTVYITNHYTQAQISGAYIYIMELN